MVKGCSYCSSCSREEVDYIEKNPTNLTDSMLETWLQEDGQISSLLWSYMEPNVSVCVIFFNTAMEVWLSLFHIYAANLVEAVLLQVHLLQGWSAYVSCGHDFYIPNNHGGFSGGNGHGRGCGRGNPKNEIAILLPTCLSSFWKSYLWVAQWSRHVVVNDSTVP